MGKLLFWDDTSIEHRSEVMFVPHRPEKCRANPLMAGNAFHGGPQTVLYNAQNRLFQMWYASTNAAKEPVLLCYTSRDGITWEAPEWGVYDDPTFPNVVMKSGCPGVPHVNFNIQRIVLDEREPDPDKRYQMLYFDRSPETGLHGVGAAASPDGIHWTRMNGGDFVFRGHDAFNVMVDKKNGRYNGYHIQLLTKGASPYTAHDNAPAIRRVVGLRTSGNFRDWTEHGQIITVDGADPVDLQHYFFSVSVYEDYYVGLLNAYYTESQVGDTVFLFSKDGIHWDKRYAGYKPDSFLPLGEEGEWDSGFLFSVQEPVLVGDRIYFYYQAMNRPHNWIAWFENERDFLGRLSAQRQWEAKLGQRKVHEKEVIQALYEELAARVEKRQQTEQAQFIRGMGLATLREDGFVSLTGRKEKPGLVITKPFPLGEKLFVNADCRAGTLTASLTDEAGNPLEGGEAFHLSGQDGTRLELPWSSLPGAERAGRNVKLHLILQDCHLYSVVY